MENEQQEREESLFTREQQNDFSSGPLAAASNEDQNRVTDEDEELEDD